MAARAGMTALIQRTRAMTAAGTADWTLGSVAYWSDDVMQETLDQYRLDFYKTPLTPIPEVVSAGINNSGTAIYKKYQIPYENLETIDSGTAIFLLNYANGGTVVEPYSVDYQRGLITFTNNMGGTAIYLTGRSYDLNETAAEIWDQKAAHYALAYDVSTDNQSLKRSQIMAQCQKMAAKYRAEAGAQSFTTERLDTR